MCRLLGVIANKEVDINFSFYLADKPFRKLSEENPDGWGIGYYTNGKAETCKEGLEEVREKGKYNFDLVKKIKSKIIISHVRKATYGDKSKKTLILLYITTGFSPITEVLTKVVLRTFLKVALPKEKLIQRYIS